VRKANHKRNQRKQSVRPRRLPSCLPDGVLHDGISFAPDWTELELERELRRALEFRAELQRTFLAEVVKRLAAIAIVIAQDAREIALAKEQKAIDKWHEAERIENAKILAAHQEELDRPTLLKRRKELAAAAKDIHRQNCEIERDRLARKGLIRGQRVRYAVLDRSNVETR
jgi:hypothetical protein